MDKKYFSNSTLKIIAMISMFIDHYAIAIILPLGKDYTNIYNISRLIGRISFPIFSFLLVEGYSHSKNIKKYLSRLFIFALLSEIPFNMLLGHLIDFNHQNVYFTLLTGLFSIYILDKNRHDIKVFCTTLLIMPVIAEILNFDYGAFGVILIILLYLLKEDKLKQFIFASLLSSYSITAPIGFIFTYFYNGKLGKQSKLFNYAFYPLHLLILSLIKLIHFQNSI